MNLIPVKSIPERTNKPSYTKLYPILEDFVRSSSRIVRVDHRGDGYASIQSCFRSIIKIVKDNSLPIKVIRRGDDIYLKKEN